MLPPLPQVCCAQVNSLEPDIDLDQIFPVQISDNGFEVESVQYVVVAAAQVVTLSAEKIALRIQHVEDFLLEGFEGRQSLGSDRPAVWLRDVKQAFVRGCRAPSETGTFLFLDEGTRDVTLIGNDLERADRAVDVAAGSTPEVFEAANRLPAD